jgi:hypothetical protein
MAVVSVEPTAYSVVFFDASVICDWARDVADRLGFHDEEIHIVIDETSPLARWQIAGDRPVRLLVDGGAFEDTRRPREMAERRTRDVVGRALLRVLDRRTEGFVDAPPDDQLTLAHAVAWDVYAVGRLARRFEHHGQRQRRLYQFRNRHGFSDAADAAFDRIWAADELDWAALIAISDEARAVVAD